MADGFVIRRWEQTTLDMIAWLLAEDGVLPSDFLVGSLERGHLEAVALMLEEYDVRTAQAIKWAVQESAFAAFGFSRLPAQAATGGVVFQCVTAPGVTVPIPSGWKLLGTDGQQFVTTAAGSILAGALTSASVPVVAVKPGVDGNVAAGVITQLAFPIVGVDAVQNPSALSGGTEIEGDDGRQNRFQRFIRTLQRGTLDALEFAATSIPLLTVGKLVSAKAIEPFGLVPPPPGSAYAGEVWLVVDDGTQSGVLDPTVSTAVTNAINGYVDGSGVRIPGWKGAGIHVFILPVTPVPVKVRAKVRLTPFGLSRWDSIKTLLSSAMQTYFAGLQMGDPVSYQNLVVALSVCDPDILEVNLVTWLSSDVTPDYSARIYADDLVPMLPLDAYAGATSRAVPVLGNVIEAGGVTVSYPEWIIQ